MSSLTYAIPNIGSKMIQPDGTVSRDWYLFLSAMLQTIGGPAVVSGGGIPPLDVQRQYEEYAVSSPEAQEALRAVDELRNELASSRNDVSQLRGLIEELSTRIAEPRTDQLRNRIESLEDRLA